MTWEAVFSEVLADGVFWCAPQVVSEATTTTRTLKPLTPLTTSLAEIVARARTALKSTTPTRTTNKPQHKLDVSVPNDVSTSARSGTQQFSEHSVNIL
jgi:hypothetical protein